MNRIEIKEGNLCIDRIEEKCLNCGMCLRTCEKINNIGTDCIACGQCILTCPSGALIPKFDYKKVINYIKDTDKVVVVFVAPAVRVAIGDEFGFSAGEFLESKLVGALKALGFDYVFDTTFGADLTIMEEANELVERIKSKKLPLLTSCCPSWVMYLKKYYPNYMDNLSTCKSPIGMISKMVKSYFSEMYDIPVDNIVAVSIAPCTSKKEERVWYPDTDISLTTRELAMMIREEGIDFSLTKEMEFDSLMGSSSTSGLIFGTSGGVTEAVLRTAYYMINKKLAPASFYQLDAIRGEDSFKTTTVDFGSFYLKVAVINKLSTLNNRFEDLLKYDFVEVMACPSGCIGGGGQPLVPIKDMDAFREKRRKSLYKKDFSSNLKDSYKNSKIQDAYISYLSKNDVNLHRES